MTRGMTNDERNDEARMTNDEGGARGAGLRHSSFVIRHSSFIRRCRRFVAPILASAALLALGFIVGSQFFGRRGYRYQGSLLWVEGRSYVDAGQTLQDLEKKVRAELLRSLPREKKPAGSSSSPTTTMSTWCPGGVMVAAPPPADPRQALAVGQKVETGSRRRAVLLDDGTPVYMNRDTAVDYDCRGELTLLRGEIYFERRPSPPGGAADKSAEAEQQVGFVVNLPNGELTTRIGKVDLRVQGDGVRIAVVRGQAFVGNKPLAAGQTFLYCGDKSVAGTEVEVVDRPLAAIAWTCGEGSFAPQSRSISTPAGQPPRDWMFLVEGCGDRSPRLARAQIEIVRDILNFAEEGDTASLIVAALGRGSWPTIGSTPGRRRPGGWSICSNRRTSSAV